MDFQTDLPACILTKVDVASMYHGLEVRPAPLDLQVLELAAQLPFSMRYRCESGRRIGKYLLKQSLVADFPLDFVHRTKQGFSIPCARWLAPGTRGGRRRHDVLLAGDSPLRRWLSPAYMEALVTTHGPGRDHSATLWLLLVLGLWLQQNPDVQFGDGHAPSAQIASAPQAEMCQTCG